MLASRAISDELIVGDSRTFNSDQSVSWAETGGTHTKVNRIAKDIRIEETPKMSIFDGSYFHNGILDPFV